MILHALGHFVMRTLSLAAAVAGGALIAKELSITPDVIGGFALIALGGAIYVASQTASSFTALNRNPHQKGG